MKAGIDTIEWCFIDFMARQDWLSCTLGVSVGSHCLIIDGWDVAIVFLLYAINIDEKGWKVLDQMVDSNLFDTSVTPP